MSAVDDARRVLHPIVLTYKVYYLVSFWVEAVLYGVYFCLFVASLSILLKKTEHTFASRVFFVGVLAMFVLITFHNSTNLYRVIEAYAYELEPAGPVTHLRNLELWDAYSFPVVLALLTWIGDLLVIFRCFLIWEGNYYVIAIPSILLLGSIVTTSVNLYWFGNMSSMAFTSVVPFLNATFPLNFAQNVLTTGLITYKIWEQHRASRRAGIISSSGLTLLDVIRILTESASVYTTQMFILMILFAINHPAQIIVQHALVPSTGIVFVLISIRTHVARSHILFQSDAGHSLVPSWLNGDESNHGSQRISRSHVPFVTSAVEQHHLEEIASKDCKGSDNL
ncbi:hypothetical protein FA15DRAFT_731794 [Coprinopsis marcescibilis]|uniref:Uncharacterized protein n=1 Tax=Coprinopsis marcescibilis TaxID=230819 RepID=A0A5C3LAE9_COPMA|nr:hypothetical protein FA15DRAFT_731794 [Coprinopsis marcescibilis]